MGSRPGRREHEKSHLVGCRCRLLFESKDIFVEDGKYSTAVWCATRVTPARNEEPSINVVTEASFGLEGDVPRIYSVQMAQQWEEVVFSLA